MSRFLEKPVLTKLSTELIKISDTLTRAKVPRANWCSIIKNMFDQVSEWTFIEVMLPGGPPGSNAKPIKQMIKTLNPEAEAIIQMGLDADCEWAKQKAAQHGLNY